jgi:DNA-directed RNA polymerase subunit RPC12/RpoP
MMAYWRCPECKKRLYGRSEQVKAYGECQFCHARLRVGLPIVSLVLAWIGWLGIVVNMYNNNVIPDFVATIFGVAVDFKAVLFVCSNLQLPWLILGYRYDRV